MCHFYMCHFWAPCHNLFRLSSKIGEFIHACLPHINTAPTDRCGVGSLNGSEFFRCQEHGTQNPVEKKPGFPPEENLFVGEYYLAEPGSLKKKGTPKLAPNVTMVT